VTRWAVLNKKRSRAAVINAETRAVAERGVGTVLPKSAH